MSYEIFRKGLDAPICLTWEITYGCNLACVHCLSSSGKRRRDELSTAEAKRLIDEWAEMKVFYINVGGGEPMSRRDFFELMDYSLARNIGVKFSTNGTLIDDAAARWIAARDYLDLQISIDGATPETNDPVRGEGSYDRARRAMDLLRKHGFRFKINATVTRPNYPEIDDLYALALSYGAELRLTRLRPTGRGAEVWNESAGPVPPHCPVRTSHRRRSRPRAQFCSHAPAHRRRTRGFRCRLPGTAAAGPGSESTALHRTGPPGCSPLTGSNL